jgi:hypothetical protein
MKLLRIYHGEGFLMFYLPCCYFVLIRRWPRLGWHCCGWAAGTLLVRVGPLVFSWWRR